MRLLARLHDDLRAVKKHDPAARGSLEIVLAYSGMHAVWSHRLTARLWRSTTVPGAKLAARMLSQAVRSATGVEIHPAATLGRRVVIDHGMGVVIGETAVVGDDVLIYHGVTLGGRHPGVTGRRHPLICDGVVLGAGSAVLGPVTIGARSAVGANAVVTRDVPPDSVVTGVPGVARPRAAGSASSGASAS